MPDEFPPPVAAVPPENTGPNLRTPTEPVRQRVRVSEASSGVPMPPVIPREFVPNENLEDYEEPEPSDDSDTPPVVVEVSNHPFKVSSRNSGTAETPVWEASVELESHLIKLQTANTKQTIVGLDSWFGIADGDSIWLLLTFTAGAISDADIEYGTAFDTSLAGWTEDSFVEDDGDADNPVQLYWRELIAVVDITGGVVTIDQRVRAHLKIYAGCVLGRPAQFVLPL